MSNETPFPDSIDPAQHEAEVQRWRRARSNRLTTPDGWLSLVARTTLHEGDNRIGSDPDSHILLPEDRAPARVGVLRLQSGVLRFEPAPSVQLQQRLAGESELRAVNAPTELFADAAHAGDRLLLGSLAFELATQNGEITVRVRDSESSRRVQFPGIDFYETRPDLRVVGRLLRHDPPRAFELDYDSGREETYLSPGIVVFTLAGIEHRVEPVIDGNGKRLFVLFADLTNRHETYGAGRFLYAPLPDGERVLLDWNQAFNPPCAYTPFAFCPLVPKQNRLQVHIEAGEKKPHD